MTNCYPFTLFTKQTANLSTQYKTKMVTVYPFTPNTSDKTLIQLWSHSIHYAILYDLCSLLRTNYAIIRHQFMVVESIQHSLALTTSRLRSTIGLCRTTDRLRRHHRTVCFVWWESSVRYFYQTQSTVRRWSQSLSASIATVPFVPPSYGRRDLIVALAYDQHRDKIWEKAEGRGE